MAAAAVEEDDDGSDFENADDDQMTLEEFISAHPLPQTVAVTQGGFISQRAQVMRGDVLLLRSLAPTQVTLSFLEADTRSKREVHVSPNISVKFKCLSPKDSALSEPDFAQTGQRPTSMITYPTIADLLLDCPTYFEANSTYDDPYLPGFSIRPGDQFQFLKIVKDKSNKSGRLQCRTESGENVFLSPDCKGNFTVLPDDNSYTIRDLLNLAKVPRRLKLAPENKDLKLCIGSSPYTRTSGNLDDLPSIFTGVINMSKPEENLIASPWGNPDTLWKIPLSANLQVRLYSESEYEQPINSRPKPQAISSFVNEFEYNLPVQALLMSYKTPPRVISSCLKECKDVIVHKVIKSKKLFVKDADEDKYFCIRDTESMRFAEIPKTFSRIADLLSLPIGTQVRVLADIASDFPQPFCLRYGDILRITKHVWQFWKLKRSSGDVPVLKFKRLGIDKEEAYVKIPLDMEVQTILISDSSQLKVVELEKIFSGEKDIPGETVSVVESTSDSSTLLPSAIKLLKVLKETEIIVSPLDTATAISPIVKTCALIPVRHKVVLAFRRPLEFPDGYFVMPVQTVGQDIEQITQSEYEELEHARKLESEYEDVTLNKQDCEGAVGGSASPRGSLTTAASSESLPTSTGSGPDMMSSHKQRLKRLSRALNPRKWRLGKSSEPEVLPPPGVPVSGIFTLAMQPSKASSNEYISSIEDDPKPAAKAQHNISNANEENSDVEDDPYEDVEIKHHPPVAKSMSHQPLTSHSFTSNDRSASASELSKLGTGIKPAGTSNFTHTRSQSVVPVEPPKRKIREKIIPTSVLKSARKKHDAAAVSLPLQLPDQKDFLGQAPVQFHLKQNSDEEPWQSSVELPERKTEDTEWQTSVELPTRKTDDTALQTSVELPTRMSDDSLWQSSVELPTRMSDDRNSPTKSSISGSSESLRSETSHQEKESSCSANNIAPIRPRRPRRKVDNKLPPESSSSTETVLKVESKHTESSEFWGKTENSAFTRDAEIEKNGGNNVKRDENFIDTSVNAVSTEVIHPNVLAETVHGAPKAETERTEKTEDISKKNNGPTNTSLNVDNKESGQSDDIVKSKCVTFKTEKSLDARNSSKGDNGVRTKPLPPPKPVIFNTKTVTTPKTVTVTKTVTTPQTFTTSTVVTIPETVAIPITVALQPAPTVHTPTPSPRKKDAKTSLSDPKKFNESKSTLV